MHNKKRPLPFAFLCALLALTGMGANCPGCSMTKDCGAYDGNKAACDKEKNCLYTDATGKCEVHAGALRSGCMDIVEEGPCRASSNCYFDEAARTCLEAPGKNACGTILNETACNADKNCQWQGDSGPCGIKK